GKVAAPAALGNRCSQLRWRIAPVPCGLSFSTLTSFGNAPLLPGNGSNHDQRARNNREETEPNNPYLARSCGTLISDTALVAIGGNGLKILLVTPPLAHTDHHITITEQTPSTGPDGAQPPLDIAIPTGSARQNTD